MNTILYSDIKEENGKTIKENNTSIQHKIPINTLVEIDVGEDVEHIYDTIQGLRMFVVKHTRDCDGTPLYCLYHAPKEKYDKNRKFVEVIMEYNNLQVNEKFTEIMVDFGIIGGLSENSLKVIFKEEEHPQHPFSEKNES